MTRWFKKFSQVIFLGAFAFSFCWGETPNGSTKIVEAKLLSEKIDEVEKPLPPASKDVQGTPKEPAKVVDTKSLSGKTDEAGKSLSLASEMSGIDFSKLCVDAAKKLGNKPFPLIIIEGESLAKLCQTITKIVDKMFPDFASLVSLSITGFMGGLSCPGVDEKAPCYVVMFLNAGNVEPVFLFKSQTDCLLVKNLTANKSASDTLKTIPNGSSKTCWQMYGNTALLKALDKDLEHLFPFIYHEKIADMCLKFHLDLNRLNDIFQKVEDKSAEWAFIKLWWDTFFFSEIKCTDVGFNIEGETIEVSLSICPQDYSPLSALIKSLDSKSKTVKFITWSSCETLQELNFQDFSGLKNYLEALNARIKGIKAEGTSLNTFKEFFEQIKNWWSVIYPLIEHLLVFCDENLTGNTQSYADLQSSKDLISSKGFGFFELKQLKREGLLKFMDDFSAKIKSSLKEAADKKYFGSEFCKNISLNVKKSVEKHGNYDIDQVFWKADGDEAYYPIWFTVHNNYLLYADDISNLKRSIERMNEMKTPSYVSLGSSAISQIKINPVAIARVLNIQPVKLTSESSIKIISYLQAGTCVNKITFSGFWDAFSLKTLLPSSSESGNKEGNVHPVSPMSAPITK